MGNHSSRKLHAHPSPLSEAEIQRLVEAVINGNGECVEEAELRRQLARVAEWVETNRIDALSIRLVMTGLIDLCVPDDGKIEYIRSGYTPDSESS